MSQNDIRALFEQQIPPLGGLERVAVPGRINIDITDRANEMICSQTPNLSKASFIFTARDKLTGMVVGAVEVFPVGQKCISE